jgi:hypothetical protein
MVFNITMSDAELIQKYGGPSKVAAMLGYDKFGVQRVQNWIKRGIPSAVKSEFPHLFLLDAKWAPVQPTEPAAAGV